MTCICKQYISLMSSIEHVSFSCRKSATSCGGSLDFCVLVSLAHPCGSQMKLYHCCSQPAQVGKHMQCHIISIWLFSYFLFLTFPNIVCTSPSLCLGCDVTSDAVRRGHAGSLHHFTDHQQHNVIMRILLITYMVPRALGLDSYPSIGIFYPVHHIVKTSQGEDLHIHSQNWALSNSHTSLRSHTYFRSAGLSHCDTPHTGWQQPCDLCASFSVPSVSIAYGSRQIGMHPFAVAFFFANPFLGFPSLWPPKERH